MDQFKTQSSPKRNIIAVVLTGIVMFAAAFWGLTVTVTAWVFFEVVVLACTAFCLFLTARTYLVLEFKGSELLLTNNATKEQYLFTDLTLANFRIKQSPAQKKNDTCDLRIADTPFQINDLQGHDAFCAYLQKHYN